MTSSVVHPHLALLGTFNCNVITYHAVTTSSSWESMAFDGFLDACQNISTHLQMTSTWAQTWSLLAISTSFGLGSNNGRAFSRRRSSAPCCSFGQSPNVISKYRWKMNFSVKSKFKKFKFEENRFFRQIKIRIWLLRKINFLFFFSSNQNSKTLLPIII